MPNSESKNVEKIKKKMTNLALEETCKTVIMPQYLTLHHHHHSYCHPHCNHHCHHHFPTLLVISSNVPPFQSFSAFSSDSSHFKQFSATFSCFHQFPLISFHIQPFPAIPVNSSYSNHFQLCLLPRERWDDHPCLHNIKAL